MTVHVDLEQLTDACEWVSAGASINAEAYINKRDGRIYWQGDGVDEDRPDDADDVGAWVAAPSRNELDLGRDLALRFVDEHLPRSYDKVEGFFHKRGAYANFKALLDAAGQLERWHAYENAALEEALMTWCADNAFVPTKKAVGN